MLHIMSRCFFVAALALTVWVAPARAELALYMIEQRGCAYCRLWDREVSVAYQASPEGARAPLVRLDLRAAPPDGVRFSSRPVFTPTFILVQDGTEIGRIEGYLSAHFFWEHLARLLPEETP